MSKSKKSKRLDLKTTNEDQIKCLYTDDDLELCASQFTHEVDGKVYSYMVELKASGLTTPQRFPKLFLEKMKDENCSFTPQPFVRHPKREYKYPVCGTEGYPSYSNNVRAGLLAAQAGNVSACICLAFNATLKEFHKDDGKINPTAVATLSVVLFLLAAAVVVCVSYRPIKACISKNTESAKAEKKEQATLIPNKKLNCASGLQWLKLKFNCADQQESKENMTPTYGAYTNL